MTMRNISRRTAGFTLVETALALGIVGFSVIAIVGLIATGLGAMNDANSDLRAAMIADRLINAAEMNSYADLQGGRYGFDIDGKAVPESAAAFVADVEVTKGGNGGAFSSPNAAFIAIEVAGPALAGRTKYYSTMLSNIGW